MKPEEEKTLQTESSDAAGSTSSEPKGPVIQEGSTIFTERVKAEEKVGKTKKKRPLLKQLLCLLLVVIVLGGGVSWAYFDGWFEEKEPETVEEAETIELTASQSAKIKSIEIKNETGQYTLIPHKDEEGTKTLKLKGYDNIPQNYDMLGSIGDYVFQVEAYRELEDKWTEADCGLDKPVVTVKVNTAKGKSFGFKLGNQVPDGSGGYYCKTSLSDKIYLVQSDHYTRFSYAMTDYVQTVLMNAWLPEGDNDVYYDEASSMISRFDSITISGSDMDKDIELAYDDKSKSSQIYLMTSPAYTYADSEAITAVLTPFNEGFIAANAYVFNPTAEDLKEYGLDDPYRKFVYKIRGETVTIRIGKGPDYEDGYYSMMFNDHDIIYKYTASQSEFMEWTDKDLRAELLFLRDITSVKSLTYELSGSEPVTYDIDVYEEDEENPVYTVTTNSKKVDDMSFRNLYGEISLIKANDYIGTTSTVSGTPYVTLTYEYNDGSDTDVVSFTKYNDRYYRFSVNGIGDELVGYQTVDSLVQHFADFIAGEEVASPY